MVRLDIIPLGAAEAWLVPALPLGAFVLIALGIHRARRVAALLSVLAIGAAFLASLGVLGDLLRTGEQRFPWTWLAAGDVEFQIGYVVSPLSTMMLALVTSVSLAVQVYSLEYMKGEPRLGWYYGAHSLFAASMLGLVLTQSLLLLYITWELVGLCSYLLIGFWYERRSAAEAAKKAFITTRLGDVGLLIGIILLFRETGTFDIAEVFARIPQMSEGTVALAAFLLFLGAMGKSAQVPFHVWLPDAMEGPTPVSALIHAATMVVAGVFLVARMFPLFVAAPAILWVVAVVGAVTALLAGVLALAEVDFKRILAYSTVSQLGLMMLALGAAGLAPGEAAPLGGLFHLLTHGYFKALLFLTAGVALHAIGHHAATIHQVRGLGRRAPLTAAALVIGGLAMAGLPPLSGFFSKEEVLAAPLDVGGLGGWLLFAAALSASFLSALYMTRLVLVVTLGTAQGEAERLHDPPLAMAVPLAVLSILAVALGLALVSLWEISPFLGGAAYHLDPALALTSMATVLAALGLGWALYGRRETAPERVRAALGPLAHWAEEGFYFDRLYQAFVDRVALAGARLLALFDRRVVNDRGVNGTGALAPVTGAALRLLQTGRVYNYALAFAVGIAVLAAVALLTQTR